MTVENPVDTPPAEEPVPPPNGARFLGNEKAFWRLLRRGAVLLLVTLGIYRFWLATDVRRSLWNHTEIAGDYLEYIGTARELLLGFLIAIALLVPINIVLFLTTLSSGLLGQIAGALTLVLLGLLGQFAVYRARRYRLTRTLYRGIRFHQTGAAWRYAICAIFWWATIGLTLGLAYPWAQASLERFKLRNTHYGDLQGQFVGSGTRLFFRGVLFWIVVVGPFVLGLVVAIGAIDWDALDEHYLRDQIRNQPLAGGRADKERPFRLACIQLATYDGTVYNVKKVMEKIGHLCDYVLWDEAWIGYNAFHPLFHDHSPMRLKDLGPNTAGLFSTQSVHKQGAGFSQASQIHKRDEHIKGQKRFIEHKRFNESFLQHASTSPFYPLFASLDVNAKVHAGKAGEMLWDRCIELGIETRKRLRELARHYEKTGASAQEKWFFDPFVPDVVTIRGSKLTKDVESARWEDLPTEVIKREQQCWSFDPKAAWHGYQGYAPGQAMVDPNKLMLLTPGIDRKTGNYLDWGVPATVLANYLREQRIVPEKCDLNSILFLMTPAEDESKLNTLIARLVKFKNLWDRDAPLAEVLPTLYAQNTARYAGYTLRQTCQEMHDFYRTANVKALQGKSFRASSFPELAMSPKDAYEKLVANEVDYVPLAEITGRVAATLALIYPPGIGVIVPGERWDARAKPMLDYFLTFEESFNRFPGFNYEVQGVYQEQVDGRIKFYTYAVRE